jgi:hypothetical protein
MRFFVFSNWQDIVLYLFPTLIFIVVFALALSFSHLRMRQSEDKSEDKEDKKEGFVFPEELEERRSPFPAALTLIIAGTVLWAFFYILFTGIMEAAI